MDTPGSLKRRVVLDLATRRSDKIAEIQIVHLFGAAVGLAVAPWWLILCVYASIQVAELLGLMMIRRVFYAARDPSDDLARFEWRLVAHDLFAGVIIAGSIAVIIVFAVPEWRLGVLAMWCLALMCALFPRACNASALFGNIAIHVVGMVVTVVTAHVLQTLPTRIILADFGLGLSAGMMAAFTARRLHADYLAQITRELELGNSVKALDRTNEIKTEFLGRLSHEMRTPMNGIMGLTALLQRTPLTDDQRRQLELMRVSGEHLVALLDDSLDLSRLEARSVHLTPTPVDLLSLLEEQVQLYAPSARERGIELVLDVPGEIPALMSMDPTRVRQCISNLLGNAIKFSDRGDVKIAAVVDTQHTPAHIEIAVADRGVGVPQNLVEAIFDPYAQARTGPKRLLEGVGLGLAITRRLARLMGGDVTYEPRPDGGSMFRLKLFARVEALSVRIEDDQPVRAAG